MRVLKFLIVALLIFAPASAFEGALFASLSQEVVSKTINYVVPKVVEKFTGMVFPTISMIAPVPVLGDYNVTITDMVLKSLSLTNTAAEFQSPNVIMISSGFGASISATVKYRGEPWPHISDTVNANITVSSSSIKAPIKVSQKAGIPVINMTSCVPTIGDLDIELSGGASWLYSILISVFKSPIINAITSAVNTNVPSVINASVEKVIAEVPFKVNVTPTIMFDMTLAANPSVTNPFNQAVLTLPFTAAFVDSATGKIPPLPVSPPPAVPFSKGVQVLFADYVANSLMYTLVKTNTLNTTMSYYSVPEAQQKYFNTTFYRFIIPTLYRKFPDRPIAINMVVNTPPVSTLKPSVGLNFNGTAVITFMVYNTVSPTAPQTFAFSLDGRVIFDTFIAIKGTSEPRITINMTLESLALAVKKSDIGTFSVDGLETVAKTAVNVVFTAVNTLLENGVPIPSFHGFSVVDPHILWTTDYCEVDFGISYTKPTLRDLFFDHLSRSL